MLRIISLLILLSTPCYALDFSPEIYITSWHSKDKPSGEQYNQFNPGIGASLTGKVSEHWKLGIRGADYRNSIDKNSAYLAGTVDYCRGDTWHICGGAMLGAVTGYTPSIKPLAAPVVGLGYDRVTLNLTAFPIQAGAGFAVSGWLSYKAWSF